MAGLTKDELRSALVNHGQSVDLNVKKDELVALYDEFVAPQDELTGEFSSDDEDALKKPSGGKKVSRSSKKSVNGGGSEKSKTTTNGAANGDLTEENSLVVGDLNVNELDDEELVKYLNKFGIEVGPIVDSTRSIYQRKLAIVMREKNSEGDNVDNGNGTQNGTHDDKILDKSVAEFSADEDAITEDLEAEQPSVVVRKSGRKAATPKKFTQESTSPLQSLGTSIRQRFGGQTPEEKREGRFTPTPRRSIHSYKITETTKQTMVKTKDGNVTHDLVYNKETSESKGIIGSGTRAALLLKVLPGIFMLLIIIALIYYVSSKRT